MSLQDKLAQVLKDQEVSNDAFRTEIAGIRQQIADSEVTYSIGDCFENRNTKIKYILAFLGDDGIDMISLESGCRWMTPIQPLRRGKVSTTEMKPLLASFARTWDARKQCKC
jgi:hypothetical protein